VSDTMKPRVNLVERISVAVLVVLLDPEAFGLPEAVTAPPAFTYGPIIVLLVAALVDGRKMAVWLRRAADAVDE
jgi:hypothetical protein